MRLLRYASLFPIILVASFKQDPVIIPERVNIVDRLGQDPDFSLLLRLLQRARLIPTLNRLEDATFFAPTNDAIERSIQFDGSLFREWIYSEDYWDKPPDNMQHQLRQHLFYHLINYTIPLLPPKFPIQRPLTLETLHYPGLPAEEPPPWVPVPGGLLNSAPQRLRVSSYDSSAWVGVDSSGRGGVQVIKEPITASNGIIIPVKGVIPLPGNLYQQIQAHTLLFEFASILTPELIETLSTAPHITLFFPIDSAWSTLDPIERQYLHSGYAERDVGRLVAMHSSGSGINSSGDVGWSDSWNHGSVFTTVEGNQLRISYSVDGSVHVDRSTVIQEDIYASNGVLHVVSSLLTKPETFQINAEKYLLALNATSFVSLLRTANLSHYVDDEHDSQSWTILAPRDDVIGGSNMDDVVQDLGRVLQYHVIPGKLLPAQLSDGMLLGTELREEGLNGHRQRLHVSVATKDGTVQDDSNGAVGFGDAQVISEPVESANFMIYLISQLLDPPGSAIEKIQSSSRRSTFLAAVFASSMQSTLKTEPSITILVPSNQGFEELGLITSYLLLPDVDTREALRSVLKHHLVMSVIYESDIGPGVVRVYDTLDGSSVSITDNVVTSSGSWNQTSRLVPLDTLTENGVIHELRGVLLPEKLRITIGDLALAADGNTMITLVRRAGLPGLLNGTLTMKDVEDLDDWKRTHHRHRLSASSSPSSTRPTSIGWTLLCPTDEAFKHVNLTRLLDDQEALRTLVLQHIIPTPAAPPDLAALYPLSFQDEATYTTLLSPSSLHGDIIFRKTTETPEGGGEPQSIMLLGIRGARGTSGETDFARLLNYGRTTTIDLAGTRSGVLQIDRVLEPRVPDWWNAWGWAVTGGLFGGAGIIVFWRMVYFFWRRSGDEATYEPLDGGNDDDEDR